MQITRGISYRNKMYCGLKSFCLLIAIFILWSFGSDFMGLRYCLGSTLKDPKRTRDIQMPIEAPVTGKDKLPAGIYIRSDKPAYMPTKVDKERGFVIYRLEPFHWDRPNVMPNNSEVTDTINVFAARNEYEPVCIGIYALRNLKGVTVHVSNLVNSKGDIINRCNFDIRIVYWWKQGNIMSSSLSSPRYLPELLLTDTSLPLREDTKFPASLVPINIARNTNKQFWITIYVPEDVSAGLYKGKITIKTKSGKQKIININLNVFGFQLAKPRYTYAIYYMYPLQNGVDEIAKKQLADIKRHGFDTVTLFCDFAKANKHSKVIEECAGVVRIGKDGKLKICIRRKPFAGTNEFGPYLDRIRLQHCNNGKHFIIDFHDAKAINQTGLISYVGQQFSWAYKNNVYALNNAAQVDACFEFEGLPEGRFKVWINGINAGRVMDVSLNEGPFVRLFNKNSFDLNGLTKTIKYLEHIKLNKPLIYFGGPNAFVIRKLTTIASNHHWGNVYFYAIDEPQKGQRVLEDCKRACKLIHQNNGRSITATDLRCALELNNLLDIAVLTWQSVPAYCKSSFNTQHKSNIPQKYWTYWQAWMENPLWNRYSAGFMLWRAGLDGAMPFIYQQKHGNSAYNDFDYRGPAYGNRDFMCTYPSATGPIPTLQWEALREGIDDARYLSTLMNLLEGNNTQQAKQIRKILTDIKDQISPYQQVQLKRWNNNLMNKLRYKIAQLILQLKSEKDN